MQSGFAVLHNLALWQASSDKDLLAAVAPILGGGTVTQPAAEPFTHEWPVVVRRSLH